MDKKAAKALSPAAQVLPKSTALVGRYSKVESLEPTSMKMLYLQKIVMNARY